MHCVFQSMSTQNLSFPCVFHRLQCNICFFFSFSQVPTQHQCFSLVFDRFQRKTNVFIHFHKVPTQNPCFQSVFYRFPRKLPGTTPHTVSTTVSYDDLPRRTSTTDDKWLFSRINQLISRATNKTKRFPCWFTPPSLQYIDIHIYICINMHVHTYIHIYIYIEI